MDSLPVLLPAPKNVSYGSGSFALALDAIPRPGPGTILGLLPPGAVTVDERAEFAREFASDQQAEAYHIDVGPGGVTVVAITAEGLLRAEATLRQLLRVGPSGAALPYCTITDWPDFRHRCASDWLINVECNRWAYDWGDGPAAYLQRIKRKLDFCYAHKINQVWFDGFGWDVNRTPHYAGLMRECSRYARERGIRLTFAGYGGGYGTSYQKSELYRCGYQGQVFYNRRPYPEGEVYSCCGCDVSTSESRIYGTCPSNEGLKAAKLAEMREFVGSVEPGYVYIHDVDTGTWEASHKSWLLRCDECRDRWPSDEMADPQGQAGAFSEWFGQISEALHSISNDKYNAAHDLTLVFTSPVYTTCYEAGQPELWEQEVEYFRVLSSLLNAHGSVQFGIREQFYRANGSRKVEYLRQTLDEVGRGHGIHVISFGGGDNYTSNDLCDVSGALANLFAGAGSVCLSNGGVHEEPLQVLNAEFLWNGVNQRYGLDPLDDTAARELWGKLSLGQVRPAAIFAEGGYLQQACRRLWDEPVADLMWQAYLCGGESGCGPVSRVWWAVTREVRRLMGDAVYGAWAAEKLDERWRLRAENTREALGYAQQAAALTDDEDVQWFARCLRVGLGFSEVLAMMYAQEPAEKVIDRLTELETHLKGDFSFEPTDLLGGDPGCWLETLESLRDLAGKSATAVDKP
ncbi:MAG: glycoside hydrolase family 20 zincin-like fold domain-containing protein [Armatimonadia bacterium]